MTAEKNDLLAFERPLIARGEIVVGIDEVGRGALAGPLTVGAVVINSLATPPHKLTDSKLLTPLIREELVEPIKTWAHAWSLGSVSSAEIDQWGLRLALAVAATRALEGLNVRPTHALIDGSFNLLDAPRDVKFEVAQPPELLFANLSHTTIVKGDQKSAAIAGASVLAKVARDDCMSELSLAFPGYGWASNKGYGVADHIKALQDIGLTQHHRVSWNLPVYKGNQ
jgi:ribonuclease HII